MLSPRGSIRSRTGLTTEVAALVVFLLGAMVMLGHAELAIGLGVVTAAVLAYKQPLHGFVDKLGWDDVYAGLRLLIATFIALPLLPNEPIDPWGALNPYSLWLLVILISSLSLVGYVLTRLLGPARGTALTGLTGGLVSSTAVTLSFAKEGRDNPQDGAGARLRHSARLGGRCSCGSSFWWRWSIALFLTPCGGAIRGDGHRGGRLRGVSLFSRRLDGRRAPAKAI